MDSHSTPVLLQDWEYGRQPDVNLRRSKSLLKFYDLGPSLASLQSLPWGKSSPGFKLTFEYEPSVGNLTAALSLECSATAEISVWYTPQEGFSFDNGLERFSTWLDSHLSSY